MDTPFNDLAKRHKDTISVVTNTIVALTFLATVVGLALNFIILDSLGVGAAAVMTTPDIILGGYLTLKTTMIILTLSYLIIYAGSQTPTTIFHRRIFMIIMFIYILTESVNFYILASIFDGKVPWFDHKTTNSISKGAFFLTSFFFGSLNASDLKSKEISKIYLVSLTLVTISVISQSSVMKAADLMVFPNSSRCPVNEYVLWAGSEILVTSCEGPPYSVKGNFYVIPRSGVVLKNFHNSILTPL